MIWSGSGAAISLHEVAFAVGELFDQPVDDGGRFRSYVTLDLRDLLRREPLCHDVAETEVARVVHCDHRADELVHLLGDVADVDAAATDEDLRVAAGGPHVLVPSDGPVAGPLRQRASLELPLVEVDEFVGVTQRVERGVPMVAWCEPELRVGQVEGAEGDICGHLGSVPMTVLHRRLVAMLTFPEIERALVVTAHPDDVDFGAAGTVATLTDAGVHVSYCIVTDGDAGGSRSGDGAPRHGHAASQGADGCGQASSA